MSKIQLNWSTKFNEMGFTKEFKEFALKRNVIDLALAVIIGAAFGAIVSSLVDDVITPLLLSPALDAIGANDISSLHWGAVKYGNFIASVIKFLVIALVLFLIIKTVNKLTRKKDESATETKAPDYTLSEKLLMEIRDSLKK